MLIGVDRYHFVKFQVRDYFMWADEAFCRFVRHCVYRRMENSSYRILDIGGGKGDHARIMREDYGLDVVVCDVFGNFDIEGLFPEIAIESLGEIDAIWSSHTLEHSRNVGLFLEGCAGLAKDLICITVPPLKHEIVGGHVSLWNAGLLIYNMITAGIDCSGAMVGSYGYNISVLTRNISVPRSVLDGLVYDSGDIRRLSRFFPCSMSEGLDGRFDNINWEHGFLFCGDDF